MPTPLRSQDPQPRDIQFKHFGVLNAGVQSKSSLFTSIVVNVILGLICLIIGAATKKVVDNRNKTVAYVVPLKEKPPEPPKPKIVPPKLPPPPKIEVKTPEPPKIKLPDVKIPDPPKPVPVVQPKPVPVIVPAPPKMVVAAAAPKPVAVNLAQNAAVPNHDLHPAPVALGHPDNPIHPMTGTPTAAVNLGNRGLQGMPPGSGGGPPGAKAVALGSGQPGGSLSGTGVRAVQGVKVGGCLGCTGSGPGNGTGAQVQQVQLARVATAPPPLTTQVAKAPVSHTPQVLYKPKPAYTAEATTLHLEGTVTVKIHVSSSGSVTVLGVVAGLGHGLDESAVRAAQAIRFKPASDAGGNPVDWEGPVNITFQIAT